MLIRHALTSSTPSFKLQSTVNTSNIAKKETRYGLLFVHSYHQLLVPFLSLLCCILASICISYTAQAQTPPPAPNTQLNGPMLLYLELVVNGLPSGHIAAVDYQDGHNHVSLQDLSITPVSPSRWENAPLNQNRRIALDQIKGVITTYDQALQRLHINVPSSWLPKQMLSSNGQRKRYPPMSSFGLLMNYDVYTNKTRHDGSYASAWNELRMFGDYGTLSNTGVYRHAFDEGNTKDDGYIRYDTRWQLSDEERMFTIELGDVITRPLTWSNPVRLGGVQLSRNFATRPDIVTYPLPQFSGEVAVPSAMDLFIDGSRMQNTHLDPGPFTITNTPFINGAGEAVIVTTDALGRQVSTTVPFYITPDLLRQHMTDYTLSIGSIRQRYGQRNFSYSTFALDGSYRYGVNDQITLELHTEATSKLKLGGIGATTRLGLLGVLNASYSYSHFGSDHGQQVSTGYQYTARHFNFGARHTWRNNNYRDLTNLDDTYRLSLQNTQINIGVPLGNYGNINAGYFSIKNDGYSRTKVTNVSWNRSFGKYGTLYISANKSNINNKQWAGMIQWSISLGGNAGNLSFTTERNAEHDFVHYVDYSRAIPSDGGWGWNAAYQNRPNNDGKNNDYRQAGLSWRNNTVELQGGVFGANNNETYWGEAKGSVVLMDQSFFVANMVRDAFVVVSTDNVPNVPVRYENSLVGETNKKGHLLVPWAPAYYAAKYEIDPLNLPINLQTPIVEQRIAVKAGSGYLLRFPAHKIIAANITLVNEQNQHLPIGSQAFLTTGRSAYIGWEGQTYFENLEQNNELTVHLPDGSSCHTQFMLDMDTAGEQIQYIGPLVCIRKTKP